MNCAGVRDVLAERSLGVMGGREVAVVERHLAWCAACRKEARDLDRATAVLPFALVPTEPDPSLEDRVVAAVRGAAVRERPLAQASGGGRRGRLATVAVLAAAFAVMGLGWGAVMAGRAARIEDSAAEAAWQQQRAFDRFGTVLATVDAGDAGVYLGVLTPVEDGPDASGSALTIAVPQAQDQALVVVHGLPTNERRVPYAVVLAAGKGQTVELGALDALAFDAGGTAELAASVDEDLRRYGRVLVRDARGRLVLRGTLQVQAAVPSPSP
jgi:hypothetical protein